ncbi:MAG: ATP-binding protein [Flavitalea sp.]
MKAKQIEGRPTFSFLQGTGEMVELTRKYNWSQNILGDPELWPQSLRTTLSIILNSKFPMFLFWGPQHICFYNDAYRPSLGNNGKHPTALGKNGEAVFPEIWDSIKPQIDTVLAGGEASWYEDQLLPIYRNGALEDVYWTFSYSPVNDETGNPAGVFVTCTETTLNVKNIRNLRTSDQRFQNLVREATVGIIVVMGEKMIVEVVNDAYGRLIDRTSEELIKRPLFDVIPESENYFRPIIDKVRLTGESAYLYDTPYFPFAKGEKRTGYLNLVYQPYKEADETITGVMVLCQDVTQNVQSKKAIEEAEEKARLAIDSAELGSYEIDLSTNVMLTSERFKTIWGVTNTLDRNQYAAAIHPDDLKPREESFRKAFETSNLEYEARINVGGHLKWVRVKGKVLFDEQQKPARILGIVQDITAQKLFADELSKQVRERTEQLEQAQNSLLNTNNYFQNIINKFETALISIVPVYENEKLVDFTYKMANKSYSVYSRLPSNSVQDKRVGVLFPGYYGTGAFEKYARVFESGKSETWELYYNENGQDVYLEVVASRMNNELIVHLTNFSEIKSLQMSLIRKIEELERSNQSLEEFAHAASHDLKEPVRKILVFTDRLKNQLSARLNEQEVKTFGKIENATIRMGALIEDLLVYSHVTLLAHEMEEVNLNDKLNKVLEDLELDIEQKNALVIVETLPVIKGYRRQLQQLFQNLIGNALKYSRPDVPPVIIISAEKIKGAETGIHSGIETNNQYYLIRVKDNGIGFKNSQSKLIFQMFQRLHNDSKYRGTGLGLSIAQKVVDNHHGKIMAEGEPGVGATFKVYLPVHEFKVTGE